MSDVFETDDEYQIVKGDKTYSVEMLVDLLNKYEHHKQVLKKINENNKAIIEFQKK